VSEGPNGTEITYSKADRLIETTNSDLVFTVSLAADDSSTIIFCNSVHGKIPTTNALVRIVYRRSRGAAGNVDANAVQSFESLNNIYGPTYDGVSITPNVIKALGGADSESIASLQTNIPASFRSQDRAVSLNDYKDLTLRVPGVIKATAAVSASVSYQGLITSKQITNDYVILKTAAAHGLTVSNVVGISGLGDPYDGSFQLTTASASTLAYAIDDGYSNTASAAVSSATALWRNDNIRVYALTDQAIYDGTLDASPTTSPLSVDSSIRTQVYDYLNPRQMFGVNTVVMPTVTLTPVNIDITLNVMSTYVRQSVEDDIKNAIKDLLSFSNVSFDQVITLGTLYRTILDIPGVDYVTINQFTTTSSPSTIDTVGISPSVKGVTTTTGTLLLLSALVVTSSGGIVTA
jgi:uncharacterized phage protein gp47/JayE